MTLQSHEEYTKQILAAEETLPQDPDRCKLHLMPPVGWLNDPNGLCQYKGAYHFFFQYSPLDANGGDKFWGHYESKDLIHWNYTGAPLSPDTAWDKDGVYSGCALVDEDGIRLYYTGNVKEAGDFDYIYTGRQANTILVTTQDGISMSRKHLLMDNQDYPQDLSCHVRDPKVWKTEDETGSHYYMVQGARTKDDEGVILVFTSPDGIHWGYVNRLQTPETFGFMWECPDYFTLEGLQVLSCSPQGVAARPHQFQNIYQSGYFKLQGDILEKDYSLSAFEEWDYGFDFYAPQTFCDELGRRILVGWVGMPDADYTNPTVAQGWQHLLTVPRELTVEDGKILQTPVAELANLRTEKITVDGTFHYEDLHAMELVLNTIPDTDTDLEIMIGNVLKVSYHRTPVTHESFMEISFPNGKGGFGRTSRTAKLSSLDSLSIIIDTSVAEIYCNNGETVFTTRYYSELEGCSVDLLTPGVSGSLYLMDSMAVNYLAAAQNPS